MERNSTGDTPSKVLVVGVGSRVKGDDAIGPLTCDRLKEISDDPDFDPGFELEIIDADVMPENFGKPIRESGADRVLFVDAANMEEKPGTIRRIPLHLIAKTIPTTHTLPLDIFIKHILKDAGEIMVIGVQPQQAVSFTEPTQMAVKASSEVADIILNLEFDDIPQLTG